MDRTTRTAWTSATDGEGVAAYDTAHGAELAVERLAAEGFSMEEISIQPLTVHPLPGWRERTRRQEHSAAAVVVSIVVAALVAFVAAVATAWGLSMIVLVSFVVAAALGTLTVTAAGWWAARVRERARGDRRVIAGAFEVRCRADVARARRVLARWWNPAAKPTTPDG